ncbi:MAG: hypothetical protein F4065_09005 [Rhodothermaceae bacterium]|nr:hypothetical protein [Rhodothermaceae bacterium]MYB90033.1 hypothetical protein [Rhodothermaceae bacterium]MYG43774.1 hypothetical protein [Rhodothermaceae bacterium]MYH12185.1 hypothetical protein [Rhodothermaceae bacterium]MYJ50532.1 hypothetical protein [Rhodothermaceae bacterium]
MTLNKPQKNILLVEGNDDMHVVWHFWNHHHPGYQPFEIEVRGDIDKLIDAISTDLKSPGRETLGILVDSNDKPIDRWKSIAHRIKNAAEIQIPRKPKPNGTIINNVRPRIGIWLMPDNASPGELEDFISRLVPEGDAIWPRANQYINEIPEGDRKFKERKESKAKVHAWLATRKEPHRMGTAITAGDLDLATPIAKGFHRWLHQLFADTP